MKRVSLSDEEKRVKKIGGALERDYSRFCQIVEVINTNYFPLFGLLGLCSPGDTELVIEALLRNNMYYWAKEAYIAKETEKIASGKLNIEKVLSQKTLKKEFPTPEEKEKVYNREIHRALVYRYNKIEDTFRKRYKPSLRGFFKYPIKVCGKALSLTSEGFVIDVEKFIEIYGDYLEANDSQTGKQHQEAADAINRFFNGQVEITDKEMERYFILEDGIVKPNPKSINREGYIRLGYRGKTKVNKT